jgi:hypothetical protein
LAEKNEKKDEAVVEFPTYEPLLRQVQDHFPHVKRLERDEKEAYALDADKLRKVVSEKTGLLVLTNPHAPSGVVANRSELKEVMSVANEYDFYVVCDEIYAEFDRCSVPTVFSIDPKRGIVTTSFTKAYGLGGLKLGTALAEEQLVDELYTDVLNTVGNSPNIVQLAAIELLTNGKESLEKHKRRWTKLKNETEELLEKASLEYSLNDISVTYWTKLPVKNTYKWINDHALPRYGLAPVPGAFFLFKSDYELAESSMIRLGLGNINPDKPDLTEAFETMEKSLKTP